MHLYKIFFGLVVFVTLAPFFLLTIFNHPSADDFCFGASIREHGFLGAQHYWYTEWTGRYISTFFLTLLNSRPPESNFFSIIPIVLIILFVVIPGILLKVISGKIISWQVALISGTVFSTFYLTQTHSISEAIYWASGSITYTFPMLMIICFLAFFTWQHKNCNKFISGYIINTIFILIIAGSSEITLILAATIGIFIFIVSTKRDYLISYQIILISIPFLFFSYISITAPGIGIRMENHEGHSIFEAIRFSISQLYYVSQEWIPMILLANSITLPWMLQLSYSQNLKSLASVTIHPVLAFTFTSISLFLIILIPSIMTDHGAPPRVLNIAQFVLLIGCIYTFWCYIFLTNKKIKIENEVDYKTYYNSEIMRVIRIWSIICLSFAILSSQNFQSAVADLIKGRAAAYSIELKERYSQIRQCDVSDCNISALKNTPLTLHVTKLRTPDDWRNTCFARQFGKKTVQIEIFSNIDP